MPDSHDDLTLMHITCGEAPESFAAVQRANLPDCKVITVSRKPGADLFDDAPKSYENIYRQMLRAAKMATTPYVAQVEDDVLYSREHFTFRPPLDTFAHNMHRWALFTWNPIYSWRNRVSNCALIAPRLLLIEALEERFAKHPNGWPPQYAGELGRPMVEKGLGVTPRKSVQFWSEVGIVQINHDNASEDRQKRHRKALGPVKAHDIYYWRKAEEVAYLWTSQF